MGSRAVVSEPKGRNEGAQDASSGGLWIAENGNEPVGALIVGMPRRVLVAARKLSPASGGCRGGWQAEHERQHLVAQLAIRQRSPEDQGAVDDQRRSEVGADVEVGDVAEGAAHALPVSVAQWLDLGLADGVGQLRSRAVVDQQVAHQRGLRAGERG